MKFKLFEFFLLDVLLDVILSLSVLFLRGGRGWALILPVINIKVKKLDKMFVATYISIDTINIWYDSMQ